MSLSLNVFVIIAKYPKFWIYYLWHKYLENYFIAFLFKYTANETKKKFCFIFLRFKGVTVWFDDKCFEDWLQQPSNRLGNTHNIFEWLVFYVLCPQTVLHYIFFNIYMYIYYIYSKKELEKCKQTNLLNKLKKKI